MTGASTVTAPPTPSSTQLGHAIRRLRLARRLSLESLAGDSQMHPTYLSAIERGLRNPTWIKLCDLAQALKITVSQLARAAEVEAFGAIYSPDQRRLTPEEFEQHFGHLPIDGEG